MSEEYKIGQKFIIEAKPVEKIEKKEIAQWLKDEPWDSSEFPIHSQFENVRDNRSVFFITPFCLIDLKVEPCGNPNAQKWFMDLQRGHDGIMLRKSSSYMSNSLSDADTVVRNCGEDFYECEYDYIVIEEIKPSKLNVVNFWFYKYNEIKELYFPISKCPQEVKDYFDECHLIRKFARVN